jgi:Mn-dependent DtxR family transcriptional regulator
MRQRAEWMKPADDAILEYVRDAGEVPPAVIARNTDMHRKYAGERCRELARYGLLDKREGGYYRLTDRGEAYLNEELDADALDAES